LADAKLEAAVTLTPVRSQVFIVSLLAIGSFSLAIGFGFLWAQRGWVSAIPLAIGLSCIGAGCWAWSRSHRNIDLTNAAPTQLKHVESGLELSADARSIDSREVAKLFGAVTQILAHRTHLPDPDGLLSPDGTPIPNSREAAIARVQAANEEAQRLGTHAVETIAQRRQGAGSDQSAAPLLELQLQAQPPRQQSD
jgi:hypothetical protein